jgi:hypothetical protein
MSRTVRLAAVAVVLLALFAALAATLARSETRDAGHNSIRPISAVAQLERGDSVCQQSEIVPADTSAIEVVVGTMGAPGPPLRADVTLESGGRLGPGRVAGGYGDGKIAIPIPRLPYTAPGSKVCFTNEGRMTVQLIGVETPSGGTVLNGEPKAALLTLAYRRAGEESMFALLPTIAHRLGIAKTTLAGSWTMWALAGIVLLASALALALVLGRDFGRATP